LFWIHPRCRIDLIKKKRIFDRENKLNNPLKNYAFIDGQNLNLSIQQMGWKLDFLKFRVYLMEKYKVEVAYYFIGYVNSQSELYRALQMAGNILVFKPTFRSADGKVKGNCDAELVLQAMIDLESYEKAIIVSGDAISTV
jgi:hypothetical protein